MSQHPVPKATIPSPLDETRLVWIDMEMTGLRPEVDRIIEVAVVITDSQLSILAQSEAFAIHQPAAVMQTMDEWNRSTHGRSGLTARVQHSQWTEAQVEEQLLAFIGTWLPTGKSPMCGNSIGQDRRFMVRYMPRLESFFHYRNLDVSTVKELCKRWRPDLLKGFVKRSAHTALADIIESIDELAYYRQHFFNAARAATPPPSVESHTIGDTNEAVVVGHSAGGLPK
jgi:oligoribonuclease